MIGARWSWCVCTLVLVCSGACAAEGPYDESWGADELSQQLASGKADGLLDAAPELAFGESVSGTVGGDRMEIYKVAARGGDQIELRMTVTSGDLDPHLSLFYGLSTYVHSSRFTRVSDTELVKTYDLESAGTYILAARAFRGEGEGAYTITSTCVAGPCAGEFPDPPSGLDVSEAADCLTKVRECSFAALPAYDGRVGEVTARRVFERCVGSVSTDEGVSCAGACDLDEYARGWCDSLQADLPYWADASTACLATLDGCLDECDDGEEYLYDVESFYDTAEYMCWGGGYNGDCDSYAKGHVDCGGRYDDGSEWECQMWCESTSGVWTDDISDLCDDCGDVCTEVRAWCAADCGASTGTCYRECAGRSGTDYYCL